MSAAEQLAQFDGVQAWLNGERLALLEVPVERRGDEWARRLYELIVRTADLRRDFDRLLKESTA